MKQFLNNLKPKLAKRLPSWLVNWLYSDKAKHFAACFILSLYRVDVAFTAGITKEYADSQAKDNKWCWWDIMWDAIGIIAGYLTRVGVIYLLS